MSDILSLPFLSLDGLSSALLIPAVKKRIRKEGKDQSLPPAIFLSLSTASIIHSCRREEGSGRADREREKEDGKKDTPSITTCGHLFSLFLGTAGSDERDGERLAVDGLTVTLLCYNRPMKLVPVT